MQQLPGLVVLVFYILSFMVIGPSFHKKGNTTNKDLQTALLVFAYIVLISSAITLPWIIGGCGYARLNFNFQGLSVICVLALVLSVLPMAASAIVVAKKHYTTTGRKAIIAIIWLHLTLIMALIAFSPFFGVAIFLHHNKDMMIPTTKKRNRLYKKPKPATRP